MSEVLAVAITIAGAGIITYFLIKYLENSDEDVAKNMLSSSSSPVPPLPKMITPPEADGFFGKENENITYYQYYHFLWNNQDKMIEWLKKYKRPYPVRLVYTESLRDYLTSVDNEVYMTEYTTDDTDGSIIHCNIIDFGWKHYPGVRTRELRVAPATGELVGDQLFPLLPYWVLDLKKFNGQNAKVMRGVDILSIEQQ